MSEPESWKERRVRFLNRVAARRATLSRPATAFVSLPAPRSIGRLSRGRQLTQGNFMFAGFLIEAPDTSIWDLPEPDPAFVQALHGFVWADDLASLPEASPARLMRAWTHEWIDRFSRGHGPGWTPELTGRRLIRWVNHAVTILNGVDDARSRAFFRSMAQQVRFVSRRWRGATPGLPRVRGAGRTGLCRPRAGRDGTLRRSGPESVGA